MLFYDPILCYFMTPNGHFYHTCNSPIWSTAFYWPFWTQFHHYILCEVELYVWCPSNKAKDIKYRGVRTTLNLQQLKVTPKNEALTIRRPIWVSNEDERKIPSWSGIGKVPGSCICKRIPYPWLIPSRNSSFWV